VGVLKRAIVVEKAVKRLYYLPSEPLMIYRPRGSWDLAVVGNRDLTQQYIVNAIVWEVRIPSVTRGENDHSAAVAHELQS